jgi:hypothetical protein
MGGNAYAALGDIRRLAEVVRQMGKEMDKLKGRVEELEAIQPPTDLVQQETGETT